jgi:hypothetical protein
MLHMLLKTDLQNIQTFALNICWLPASWQPPANSSLLSLGTSKLVPNSIAFASIDTCLEKRNLVDLL